LVEKNADVLNKESEKSRDRTGSRATGSG